MQTNAHFENIKATLIQNIKSARLNLKLAVAWLTDGDLIRELAKLAENGIAVEVAISDDPQNFINAARFKAFLAAGGKLYICKAIFLHHKFCVIDDKVLINGSYNWSYAAQRSEENIIIYSLEKTGESADLFKQFSTRFKRITNMWSTAVEQYSEIRNLPLAAAVSLNEEEKALVLLHQNLEAQIDRTIKESMKLKVSLNFDDIYARIKRDGGGAHYIKRILQDEMDSREMKSGFNKLLALDPPRLDLSLEYLVCIPEYRTLFTNDQLNFCLKLMQAYGLFKDNEDT